MNTQTYTYYDKSPLKSELIIAELPLLKDVYY